MFKRGIGWIIGVLIASYGFSIWRDESIDWDNFITLSIGGIVGILIVEGIRKAVKKDRD